MFDRQPSLSGNLISIRPLEAEDFEALYAAANDPLLWAGHPSKDRHELPIFKQYFDDALQSLGALIVVNTQTKQVIGSSRYHGYDEERSEIEIGWTFLARSHWGGAANRQLKQLMLTHAFNFVKQVLLVIEVSNIRSHKGRRKNRRRAY